MLESLEGCVDVSRHGDVNVAIVVVPIECDAAEKGSVPVDGDCFVILLECRDKVLGVRFGNVLDSEIVDD